MSDCSSVYQQRRQRLLAQLPEYSVVILATAPISYRNRDADYKYRPDSSFYYLTGFAEPNAVMILVSGSDTPYYLLVQPSNKAEETWTGRRAGIAGAISEYGADHSEAIDQLDKVLLEVLTGQSHLVTRFNDQITRYLALWQQSNPRQHNQLASIINIDQYVDDLRLVKDEHEIYLMTQAANIAATAHCRAMTAVAPQMTEYQLEAELIYVFAQNNSVPAYNSIVAGGDNANILHYVDNQDVLQDGDLVLIDAGAEYGYYASDITRTFPINGQFTSAQRAVYDVVLAAQSAAIAELYVGNDCKAFHTAAIQVLTQGLIDLGILSVEDSSTNKLATDTDNKSLLRRLIDSKVYLPYYMHGTGHWLGMDVHDVGDYYSHLGGDTAIELRAGMVVTVEPGLYLGADDTDLPEQYRGIGIRIEDDVLITEQGAVILTDGVPKSPDEIEAFMSNTTSTE